MMFAPSLLSANDSYVEGAGGSYTMAEDGSTEIRMESELVRLTLEEKYYKADITFLFKNYGGDMTVKIGFPEYRYGTQKETDITSFKTDVDGKNMGVITAPDSEQYVLKKWFIKEVHFTAGEEKVSHVSYEAQYGRHGSYSAVEYLYGTGRPWKGTIGSMTYEIVNNIGEKCWIYDCYFDNRGYNTADNTYDDVIPINIQRSSDSVVSVTASDVEPGHDDRFCIEFSTFVPAYDEIFESVNPSTNHWNYEGKLIPERQLALLSSHQLRIMRNFIYALYGRTFRDKDLQQYFSTESWYKPDPGFSEDKITGTDRENIGRITAEEVRRSKGL
jgi:hypothetical protein